MIGRSGAADIRIPHPDVSRRHAVLARDGDGFRLDDCGSANGTWLNGRRLAPGETVRLRGGEDIRFGGTRFRFDPAAGLVPVEFPARVALKHGLTIGRGRRCDVVVPDPNVSRVHSVIERVGDRWSIRDRGRGGTFVNGRRVAEAVLRDGDRVQVGNAAWIVRGGALEPCDGGEPMRLDVRHVSQKVCRRGKELVLLDDISFSVRPSELVAIVGASGAGKSTLIKALNGMRPACSGAVYLNGVSLYEHHELFQHSIGYVPQDDIVHRELPVRSVLRYAARLRLPEETSDSEVEQLIETVLDELELSHRKDALVSTLSGGERKRVNIGVELLTSPRLLLLDEPTSGLDPGLEKRVVALLRRLAAEGRTVLFATHASESVGQCDMVLFLARGGEVAFYGPPDEVLEFFGVEEFSEAYLRVNAVREGEEPWPARFRRSEHYHRCVEERWRDGGSSSAPSAVRQTGDKIPGTGISSGAQFRTLALRYAEVIRGDFRNLLILLAQAPAIALILALIYKSSTFSTEPALTPGAHPPVKSAPELLFLMVIAALWFGTTNAAREITKERAIFARERLAGVRVWPYLLSKLGVLGLLCLFQSASLLGIVGLRVEYPPDGPGSGALLLTLFLASFSATLLGLAISAASRSSDQAMSLVPLAILPQVILSGMLVDLESLGPMRALASLMPGRWAYGALTGLMELSDRFDRVGIGRHAKSVFDTSPAAAWLALVLIGWICLASCWVFLSRRAD